MPAKLAFNMLPWYRVTGSYRADLAPPLAERLRTLKNAGYDGVHTEIPPGMTPMEVGKLYAEAGLQPAPGYFQADFSDPSALEVAVESAKAAARQHAELGLDRIFLAEPFAPERVAAPGEAAGTDPARLARIADGIGKAAEAMVAEGVIPCLHQHVGSYVESWAETEAILSAVPESVLLLGPDTGHLSWVDDRPVSSFMTRHRSRIGAVHIKDMRRSIIASNKAVGGNYWSASAAHVWTEPGRGDIDLEGVFKAMAGFEGWYVVEVDIADQPTVEQTAQVAADWMRPRIAGR